jgi:hypothetical protein
MCSTKINPNVHNHEVPAEAPVEFLTTAKKELAAFYQTVCSLYGPKEAGMAAQDWIEQLETMDWPADGAAPNWRHVTIGAADCLAFRIIDHSPSR